MKTIFAGVVFAGCVLGGSVRAELILHDTEFNGNIVGLQPANVQISPSSVNQNFDPVLAKLAWKLIGELSAPSYKVREFARTQLVVLGRAAIEPLEFAARDDDSETRMTAMALLIELRGRGFMGVGMAQTAVMFDGEIGGGDFPPMQVSLNLVGQSYPAEVAGLMVGDVILELNGQSVQDINDLQREVIVAGPARNLSVLVLRGEERVRMTVRLMDNSSPVDHPILGTKAYTPPTPPVDLTNEIPVGERVTVNSNGLLGQGRIQGQGVMIINGQVIRENLPAPKPRVPSGPGLVLDGKFVASSEARLEKLKQSASEDVRGGVEEAK